jgi:3-hydroxybutyryl-CoA dehydrogenase
MNVDRPVGVVGAGTMGVGVAQAFAMYGHRVVLIDHDAGSAAAARERIATDARLRGLTSRTHTGPAPEELLALIRIGTDFALLADASYLVENITENWPAKRDLHHHLDTLVAADCVIAVNTSAIPITRVAAQWRRPERVIGNHFMNPVPVMPTVEVVRGLRTSDETVERSRAALTGIGKKSVVVRDSPGFVTNRVAMLSVNEAMFLLAEGVSSAVDIDRLFRQCLGHRMGPLETADLIGLDTVLYSLEVLQDEFGDPKYRPCPLLRRLVEAGRLGRKSGWGFHRYEAATAALPEEVKA